MSFKNSSSTSLETKLPETKLPEIKSPKAKFPRETLIESKHNSLLSIFLPDYQKYLLPLSRKNSFFNLIRREHKEASQPSWEFIFELNTNNTSITCDSIESTTPAYIKAVAHIKNYRSSSPTTPDAYKFLAFMFLGTLLSIEKLDYVPKLIVLNTHILPFFHTVEKILKNQTTSSAQQRFLHLFKELNQIEILQRKPSLYGRQCFYLNEIAPREQRVFHDYNAKHHGTNPDKLPIEIETHNNSLVLTCPYNEFKQQVFPMPKYPEKAHPYVFDIYRIYHEFRRYIDDYLQSQNRTLSSLNSENPLTVEDFTLILILKTLESLKNFPPYRGKPYKQENFLKRYLNLESLLAYTNSPNTVTLLKKLIERIWQFLGVKKNRKPPYNKYYQFENYTGPELLMDIILSQKNLGLTPTPTLLAISIGYAQGIIYSSVFLSFLDNVMNVSPHNIHWGIRLAFPLLLSLTKFRINYHHADDLFSHFKKINPENNAIQENQTQIDDSNVCCYLFISFIHIKHLFNATRWFIQSSLIYLKHLFNQHFFVGLISLIATAAEFLLIFGLSGKIFDENIFSATSTIMLSLLTSSFGALPYLLTESHEVAKLSHQSLIHDDHINTQTLSTMKRWILYTLRTSLLVGIVGSTVLFGAFAFLENRETLERLMVGHTGPFEPPSHPSQYNIRLANILAAPLALISASMYFASIGRHRYASGLLNFQHIQKTPGEYGYLHAPLDLDPLKQAKLLRTFIYGLLTGCFQIFILFEALHFLGMHGSIETSSWVALILWGLFQGAQHSLAEYNELTTYMRHEEKPSPTEAYTITKFILNFFQVGVFVITRLFADFILIRHLKDTFEESSDQQLIAYALATMCSLIYWGATEYLHIRQLRQEPSNPQHNAEIASAQSPLRLSVLLLSQITVSLLLGYVLEQYLLYDYLEVSLSASDTDSSTALYTAQMFSAFFAGFLSTFTQQILSGYFANNLNTATTSESHENLSEENTENNTATSNLQSRKNCCCSFFSWRKQNTRQGYSQLESHENSGTDQATIESNSAFQTP